MKRITSVLAALAVGVFLLIGQAVAAPGDKLVVDDDGEQCRNAEFTTIQEAVDAAAPGDKIKVCAGLYEESVQVDKSLFLKGEGGNPEKRTEEGDPTKEAIVDPPTSGTPGFNLQADNVRVRGFTVTGAEGNGSSGEASSRARPTPGTGSTGT